MATANGKTIPDTIGRDNGIGDIFTVWVRTDENTDKGIIVYGGNLQGVMPLVRIYGLEDRVVKIV